MPSLSLEIELGLYFPELFEENIFRPQAEQSPCDTN